MIICNNVSKKFGRFQALNNISFGVSDPAIIGVVGANGAGKTTLLKILSGCWRATAGEINVFDHQPFNSLFVAANSIFVDDQMSFSHHLTLGEIMAQGKAFYQQWDDALAKRLFSYFQFSEKSYHWQLSKGKKSTFHMVFAIATQAALTIYDEPTTGMDRAVRYDYYRAILRDYLQNPRMIFISTHHLEEIEDILEQVIFIDGGELRLHTSIDDLREYAFGVRGNKAEITQWMQGKKVLFQKEMGIDELYVVIRNESEFTPLAQFQITNVSSADVLMYLSRGNKGGIDYVFTSAN